MHQTLKTILKMVIQKYRSLKELVQRKHHILGHVHFPMFKNFYITYKMQYKIHNEYTEVHFRALLFLLPWKRAEICIYSESVGFRILGTYLH